MRTLLSLFGLAALGPFVAAQTCELVADINTQPTALSSWPGGAEGETPVEVGGSHYFRAWTKATGMELWRTDGTTASTVLVSDIVPGPDSSDPRELVEHGGALYFTAEDPVAGRELWRSDGTPSGTALLKDIGPGVANGQIGEFTSVGSRLFFVADDGVTGLEIWSTDGTGAGTSLTSDAFPGPGTLAPADLTAGPGGALVLFAADVPGMGRELAALDTQTMTAATVKDIWPGTSSSFPTDLVLLGGQVLFRASTPGTGGELFATDGTAAGTQLVKDIEAGTIGSLPRLGNSVELAGELYFGAAASGIGGELWKTDGTAAGTTLAADVGPGNQSGDPSDLVAMNGEVYFAATQAQGVWRELWATSGTPGSLRLVKDIAVGPASNPTGLTVSGNRIFFRASKAQQDAEPWVSDGTAAGTLRLADLAPGNGSSAPTGFAALPGGKAVFTAATPVGVELMLSDGTPAGTVLLRDIEPGTGTQSSSPLSLAAISGQELYFTAYTPDIGFEPRRWTAAGGVQLIAEIDPGLTTLFSTASDFTEAWIGDHRLTFFRGFEPTAGFELWVTDGTPMGSHLVTDINPGLAQGFVDNFLPALDRFFFTALETGVGWGIWITDGTAQGTLELANLGFQGVPSDLVELGESVLFSFAGPSGDTELWTTDGTVARTQLLVDIYSGGSSAPRLMTRVQDKVVFTARGGFSSSQRDLYITDGTAAGTKPLLPIGTGPQLVEAGGFVEMGGNAYFLTGWPTLDLWKIDPIAETATLVTVVTGSGFAIGQPQLTATHDKLFFRLPFKDAQGNDLGRELIVSDGTAAGTHLVADLAPGSDSSYATELVPANDAVYFTLDAGQLSSQVDLAAEIYFTDGTAAGTYQVCARPAGVLPKKPTTPLSSAPTDLTLAGGSLFWSASDPNGVGRELFRIPQPGGHTVVLEPSGSGQRIRSNDPVLGTTLTVTGSLGSTTDVSVLVMSAPVAAPHTALVAYGSAAWVELASLSVLAATATPDWTYSSVLPATPALAGAQFTLQSWTLAGPAVFPAATSNGLTIVLGN